VSTSPSGARGEGQREVRIARSPWRLADGPGLQGRRRSREVPGRDGSVTMASGRGAGDYKIVPAWPRRTPASGSEL